jgi:Flp pilus assembly protein TadG
MGNQTWGTSHGDEEPTVSNSRLSAPSGHSRLRLRRGDESGAALVEFALVVGIFVFVLYGLISFGMILAQKQRITNAAAEAARSAVGETSSGNAVTAATARVTKLLGAPGSYTATYDATYNCVSGQPNCIQVTITYDNKNHPLVPPAPGLGLFTPDTFTSTAVVQYK